MWIGGVWADEVTLADKSTSLRRQNYGAAHSGAGQSFRDT